MTERKHDAIPARLDRMEPGPALAAFLASIDVNRVSPHDRVTVLRAEQRMASYFEGRTLQAMTSAADHYLETDPDLDLAWDGAATEIRCALRLTRRSAESTLDLAMQLRDRIPRVLAALEAGDIDRRRAWVLAKETSHLADDVTREVIDSVIDDAPGLTTGQLAAQARRLAQQADAEAAEERYHSAVQNRRVVVEATADGTADLIGVDLPPHRVAAAKRRINRMALDIKTSTEDRTMDQIRADVFLDLLEGAPTSSKDSGRACVDIRVDLTTLAGLDDNPGELNGFGPVIADIASQVAGQQHDAEWRYTVTHPDTGLAVGVGTTRRRPTAAQRRHVEARDQVCVFPGCRMPATECDLDHRITWAESRRTATDALAPGCRHDHYVRHHHAWTYIPLPGGDYLWTSPLGHLYTTSGKPP